MTEPVIGVVGGCGGSGASTFAAALAALAPLGILIDLDPSGGGIDVLLGMEDASGARWSGLQVGGGHLDPGLLAEGLPHWRSVPVLAADAPVPEDAVAPVLDAATSLGTVVLDLPRLATAARARAVARCALIVVVARAGVRELVAAQAVLAGLPAERAALVLRRGTVAPRDAAAALGVPVLAEFGAAAGRWRDPAGGRLPRRLAHVAAGVLDGLGEVRENAVVA